MRPTAFPAERFRQGNTGAFLVPLPSLAGWLTPRQDSQGRPGRLRTYYGQTPNRNSGRLCYPVRAATIEAGGDAGGFWHFWHFWHKAPIGRCGDQPSQTWPAGRLATWPLDGLCWFVRAVQLVQFALARR